MTITNASRVLPSELVEFGQLSEQTGVCNGEVLLSMMKGLRFYTLCIRNSRFQTLTGNQPLRSRFGGTIKLVSAYRRRNQ